MSHIFLRVCTRVRVCLHACEYIDVRARALACACARVALLIQHATCHHITLLRPLWLYHIFQHYLTKGGIFGKKLLNIKYVF